MRVRIYFVVLLAGIASGQCGPAEESPAGETESSHRDNRVAPQVPDRPVRSRPIRPPANLPGDPAARDALFQEARALVVERQFPRAIARLNRAIETGPEDARCRLLLGICRSNDRSDVAGARQELERACELDPDNPEPPFLLAQIALKLGDHRAAGRHLDEVLRLAENHDRALVMRAGLLRSDGKDAEALDILDRYLAGPGERLANAYYERGLLHLRAGRYEQAAADFQGALAVDPADSRSRFNLANALRKLGRAEEARETQHDFELLRKVFSESIHDHETDPVRKEEILIEICERFPTLWTAWMELSRTRTATRGLDGAIDTMRDAIERFPEQPELRAAMASLLLQKGDRDGAAREREIMRGLLR